MPRKHNTPEYQYSLFTPSESTKGSINPYSTFITYRLLPNGYEVCNGHSKAILSSTQPLAPAEIQRLGALALEVQP